MVEIKNRLRIIYGALFFAILITEIHIALFVHNTFIRSYVGDMLVTLLICCFVRMIIPEKIKALSVYVFLFSALVEIGQYFDFVKLLGFDDNVFISTLLGRTFSVADLICYVIGCAAFVILEYILKRKLRS